LRGTFRNFNDQIPHSGLRIHLKGLGAPANAALAVFVDANPKNAVLVAREVECRGAEASALG
jgi:hypothetical protein